MDEPSMNAMKTGDSMPAAFGSGYRSHLLARNTVTAVVPRDGALCAIGT